MATVAALIKTAFIIVTRLVGISTIISSGDEAYDGPLLGQVIGMAGTVPEGFLAGFVVWRVPRLRVWRGVLAGFTAMVLMYPASALLDVVVVLPLQQLAVGSAGPLSELLWLPIVAPIWVAISGILRSRRRSGSACWLGRSGERSTSTVERSPPRLQYPNGWTFR